MPSPPDTAAPDAEAERLYGLDPEEFVAARDAAAKALRGDGRRAEAAAVAKLRKPSVAAWVVNRLARDEPELVEALLAAGAKLREVQLAGGSPSELRTAIEHETSALDALMRPAGRIARGSGSGRDTALERARETLHAAALDPDLADHVRRGVIVREGQAIGFPLGAALPERAARAPATAPGGKAARGAEPEPAPVPDEVAAKRLERAAAAAATAAAKLDRAEQGLERASGELSEAKAELARARRVLKAAETRVDGAERAAAAAERARDAARAKAEEAAARHRELGGG
jgi:exonuclease VII small subunit